MNVCCFCCLLCIVTSIQREQWMLSLCRTCFFVNFVNFVLIKKEKREILICQRVFDNSNGSGEKTDSDIMAYSKVRGQTKKTVSFLLVVLCLVKIRPNSIFLTFALRTYLCFYCPCSRPSDSLSTKCYATLTFHTFHVQCGCAFRGLVQPVKRVHIVVASHCKWSFVCTNYLVYHHKC